MAFAHFQRLSDEKQRDILNASLEEFVQYGYDMASTNRIVERAGIAKGTLFKYFSNKETLFLYLCEQCAEEIAHSYEEELDDLPNDFIQAIKRIAFCEITLSTERPELFYLFQHMAKHPGHPVYRQVIDRDREKTSLVIHRLIQLLGKKRLKEGVSLERILLLMTWVIEGLKQKIFLDTEGMKQMPKAEWERYVQDELDQTFDLLKRGIF